jgi:hypothetical protein
VPGTAVYKGLSRSARAHEPKTTSLFWIWISCKNFEKTFQLQKKIFQKKIFFDSRTKIISRLIHLILTNTRPVLAEASVVVLPEKEKTPDEL